MLKKRQFFVLSGVIILTALLLKEWWIRLYVAELRFLFMNSVLC